jgi:outer membrane protein assembly factor BamB/subtilisin family serine protease
LRRFFARLLLLAATISFASAAPATDPDATRIPFTAAELAQGFREQILLAQPHESRRTTVDTDEAREGIKVRELFSRFRDLRIIEVDPAERTEDALQRLRATGRYEFVEPDYIRQVATEPTDPQFVSGALWVLKNTGLSNGLVGADIKATAAWDLITQAPNVVVAVVDTGVNINHEELAGNIWRNPSPTFGDVNGARFISDVQNGDVTDDNGHGTHVAGIIGAIGNNAAGIAGIAWRVQIMPVKVFPRSGYGSSSDIARGVNYAISRGAKIINASYGESGSAGFTVSQAELAAINGARAAGIIFVAAAGNSSVNLDVTRVYPASHLVDNMVTVGASTRRDEVAPYSNYGSAVDLFAPGSEIVSLASSSNTGVATKSGTSMAAPHVTGAMVLLKARFPTENYRQLINRLLASVDRAPRFTGKSQTGGRLNLYRALTTTSSAPFNDRFSDRPRLTGDNLRLRATNLGATSEAGEPVHGGVATTTSIWWEWVPEHSGAVTIDTAGSAQDTVLAVYNASGGAIPASLTELIPVAANDNDGTVTTSKVTFPTVAGAVYEIAVTSPGAGGLVALNVNSRPNNDPFSGALTLTGESLTTTGYSTGCSVETGEPSTLGFAGGNSLWYRWTAPRNGRFQVAVESNEFDPTLAIYTGTAVTSLTTVVQNDNAGPNHPGPLTTLTASAGTTYYIKVDGKTATDGGAFTLTLTDSLWQGVASDTVTGAPAIGADGTVYVGSTDHVFYAFAPDGTTKWTFTAGGLIDTCSAAIAADGTVYIGSNDGTFYALTPAGILKWKHEFGAAAPVSNSAALAGDGTIYVKAGDGYLYALNPSDGTTKWRKDVHSTLSYASPSLAADGTVYQGSEDGNLYAFNPDGTAKWTFKAGNDIYTAPAVDAAGNIYFSVLNNGKLFSLTSAGVLRWGYDGASLGATSSPALSPDGGTVYYAGYDARLHAVQTSSGQSLWVYDLPNEVRASSPAVDANGVIYIGCYDGKVHALNPDGTLKRTYPTADWVRSSPTLSGTTLYFGSNDNKVYAFDVGVGPASGAWPQYRQNARRTGRALPAPGVTIPPASTTVAAGGTATFAVAIGGASTPGIQWQRNGLSINGANAETLSVSQVQPFNTGLYSAAVTIGTTSITDPAILGLTSTAKAIGSATELRADIVHANGNIYDQVALEGSAAAITADPSQIVRMSFVDLNDDIVQVEFSGAGTLSLTLESPTALAEAVKYVQPGVRYMKGHASIVIAGADQTTNVSVFSVGRITAVSQDLFRNDVTYDGVADLASIAILSRNGSFGGIRAGNASFFNTHGFTGIYAPGIQFTGPVILGDISASDSATPVILLGSATETFIAGGDLLQSNGRAVRVSGLTSLRFVAGANSHGVARPAQVNQARLEQNGAEVTRQIVVNPAP